MPPSFKEALHSLLTELLNKKNLPANGLTQAKSASPVNLPIFHPLNETLEQDQPLNKCH